MNESNYSKDLVPLIYRPNPVLPLTYDDSISYLEMLGKTINSLNENKDAINQLGLNFNELQKMVFEKINEVVENIKKMLKEDIVNLIPDGGIPYSKMDKNFMSEFENTIIDSIHEATKFVTFGLKGDYFCAWIPESWNDITFSTSSNGELCLTM